MPISPTVYSESLICVCYWVLSQNCCYFQNFLFLTLSTNITTVQNVTKQSNVWLAVAENTNSHGLFTNSLQTVQSVSSILQTCKHQASESGLDPNSKETQLKRDLLKEANGKRHGYRVHRGQHKRLRRVLRSKLWLSHKISLGKNALCIVPDKLLHFHSAF